MKTTTAKPNLDAGILRLLAGQHQDPFEVLGCLRVGGQWRLRALLPGAAEAQVVIDGECRPMVRKPRTDFFTLSIPGPDAPEYQLRWRRDQGEWRQGHDPYRFAPVIVDLDLHLFA